ncbi:hypothetical protein N181_11740 [Sinorhizobium fredii USDA 205]|nr:hypothetical protein AB395_0000889 [Sinorhizobium fredii CCBAU 45436]AWM24360.1 hypothetical protein AOX55_00001084 [Sinorhizobium fredii CCBAU 25509]KSV90386.1 hypothetical protein N181_11740 [Sinorhizobium fredii USDA 205]GLS10815.1 hypothetical protein GCM10007864_44460 [Sinorhizobium fredii]
MLIMFETKFAIALRDDLAQWQKLNVTAFLATGIAGQRPEIIGEPYRDAAGNVYNALSIQPIIVLSADAATLSNIQRRALERNIRISLYVDGMFSTGHDRANREVFSRSGPDEAAIAGIAIHAERKLVDKITKGAKLHG